MRTIRSYLLMSLLLLVASCDKTSDEVQTAQQEKILMEGSAQTGMPAVKNFTERKLAKMLIEIRDQQDLPTYAYVFSPYLGRLIKVCDSIGFPLPYATQYTNPQKLVTTTNGGVPMAQADPNGLFSPSSSRASWILCKVPGKDIVKPAYSETDLMVFAYPMPGALDLQELGESAVQVPVRRPR